VSEFGWQFDDLPVEIIPTREVSVDGSLSTGLSKWIPFTTSSYLRMALYCEINDFWFIFEHCKIYCKMETNITVKITNKNILLFYYITIIY
jgi:hypothetical protein